MEVSIIIPTYNRVNELDDALNSVLAQTVLPLEVIIVDDSDGDCVQQFAKEKTNVFSQKGISLKFIRNFRQRSLTIARNIGIDSANGDIIMFLDDDVILENSYVLEILKVFQNFPDALGVQGFISNYPVLSKIRNAFNVFFFLPHQEKNMARVLPSWNNSYPSQLDSIIHCEWLSGSNHCLKRDIFKEFRYDEKLKRYCFKEDMDLSFRIFKKYPQSLFMTPFARLQHKHSPVGRMPGKNMILMEYCYNFYFFYKNINQTFFNILIFYWSIIGYFVVAIPMAFIKSIFGSNEMIMRLNYSVNAFFISIKNIEKIKQGDLTFLDNLLIK